MFIFIKDLYREYYYKIQFLVNCRCSFSKTGRNCIVPSFFASIYTPFKHPTCIVKSHYKGLHIWASYVCFLLKFGSLYTWSWNYLPFMSARRFFLVGCKFCFLHCLVLSCIICLFVLLFQLLYYLSYLRQWITLMVYSHMSSHERQKYI